jgi:hypothetical protein
MIIQWRQGEILTEAINHSRGVLSVLPLPVGTGRPRPTLSKKSIDFDHEIMNLVEKNVGTSAILGKTLWYFTRAIKHHSRAVSHRNYFAWRKWGIHFQRNRNDFPKVSFTLDVIWGHGALFCNWKWIKWLRLFFYFFLFFLRARSTTPRFRARFLTFTDYLIFQSLWYKATCYAVDQALDFLNYELLLLLTYVWTIYWIQSTWPISTIWI